MRLLPVLVAACLLIPATADAKTCARPSAAKIASLDREYPLFKRALVLHFGRAWKEAAVVSWGEGSWHWFAENGCYRGTFQMGCDERRRYGHSNTLAGQVAAAARYWRASGRDWSPWDCRP